MQMRDWAVFVQELNKLKLVERKTVAGNRQENSAEHSWQLAMAVLAFHKSFGGFELGKALEMALLHDVVEIDAGDTFIYADQSNKAADEAKAAERIFGLLPGNPGAELKATWEKFEAKDTPEARIVSALDRFLPMLVNYHSEGYSWKKHNVRLAQVLERNKKPILAASPELWAFTERMLEDSIQRGYLSE